MNLFWGRIIQRKRIFIFLFILIFLLSFRIFILKEFDSVGHNWDWGFPALKFLFQRIDTLSLYSWNDFNLGRDLNLQSQIIPNLIISSLAFFLSVKISIFCVLVSAILIAFFSFKKMLGYIVGEHNSNNYLPSILYALSPFLFNEIIGGSWYMWISYAFVPLLFLNLVKFSQTRMPKNLVGFLLATIFVISSMQNFVLIEVISVSFLLYKILLNKISAKEVLKNYLWAHLILILVNLYWIIPFIYSLGSFWNLVTSNSFTDNFSGVKSSTQGIIDMLSIVGYLNRNIYYYSLQTFIVPLFLVAVFSFWVSFVFSIAKKSSLYQERFMWLLIFLISSVFVKGGSKPFSEVTMYLFNSIPLMSLYRSPQHLMLAPAFIIPILFAFSLHYFLKSFSYKRLITILYAGIIIVWTAGWWYNGDLGSKVLLNSNRDHVDFYNLPSDVEDIYKKNESDDLNHRIVFLPTSYSPDFLKNDYQNKAQGGQPEYNFLKNPTFSSEFIGMADKIDNKFCKNETLDLIKYLSLFNARYVSIRYDIYPHHTICGINKLWNIEDVQKYIDIENRLQKNIDGENAKLYRINDSYFLPLIYVPQNNIVIKGDMINIAEIASGDSYNISSAVFWMDQNKNSLNVLDNLEKVSKRPTLEFKKISPIKYRVRVHNADSSFPLIFSQSFNRGWQLYPRKYSSQKNDGEFSNYAIPKENNHDQSDKDELKEYVNKKWITALNSQDRGGAVKFISKNFQGTIQNDNLSNGNFMETFFQLPAGSNADHVVANEYANAWIISPEKICKGEDNICAKNSDGTRDMEFIIEFWPQRLFYLGILLSSMVALLLTVWFWNKNIRNNYYKN